MTMLWRTWYLVLMKMKICLQATALLLEKMPMQIIIYLQNKTAASQSIKQKGWKGINLKLEENSDMSI